MGAQVLPTLDHIYPPANQRGGLSQLHFQVVAVIYQHDLVVVQVRTHAQHARQKHHGERLARTLRVPHHAAALHGRLTSAQARHDFVGSAKLLVTAHHLDARPAIGVHKHRAGAQNLQQVAPGQHACNQLLLSIQRRHALAWRVRLRVQRFPCIKMLFARGDGAVIGLQPTTANQQQAAVKQARLALFQTCQLGIGAAAHVALQLHKGFLHRVGASLRTLFALHHAQRHAIHKQHDVGNDETLHAARRVDAELVDGVKLVVFGRCEVNQTNHRVALAGQLIHIHLRFEQQRLNRLVGLQQRAVGLAQQLVFKII